MEEFEGINVPSLEVRYLTKGWFNKKYLVELDAQSLLNVRRVLKREADRLYATPSFDINSPDAQKRIIEASKLTGMVQLIDSIIPQ